MGVTVTSMLTQDDVDALRRVRRIGFYFRYRLRPQDFSELRSRDGKLRGYFTAKPLYGRLTERGRVDRSAGFNGEIAVLFVPEPVAVERARLLFTRIPPARIATVGGRRNWPSILAAAEAALRRPLHIQ